MELLLKSFLLLLFLQPGINLQANATNKIEQDTSVLPRFTWLAKTSFHVWFPSGLEDTIKLWQADAVGEMILPCLYEGVLEGESSSSVAVSGCQNDALVIVVMYTKLSPNHTMFNIRNGITESVQKASFDQSSVLKSSRRRLRKRGTFLGDDYDDVAQDGAVIPDPPPFLQLDVKLAFEESFLAHAGSEDAARAYIARVFTLGKHHMRHATLGTSIRLTAKGPIRRIHDKYWKPTRKDLMESKESKEHEQTPIAFFCYNEDRNNDTGISYPRRVCDESKGVAIVAARSDLHQVSQTYIHESGHWLGFQHDADEDEYRGSECEGTGIMSNASAPGGRPSRWSVCSKLRLKTWLSKPQNTCLKPDDKLLQLEDACMAVTYDSVIKSNPKCHELTVSGANCTHCNGHYRLSGKSSPWSPSRPVYAHVSAERYIYWTARGHGWAIGNKDDLLAGNYFHYSGLDSSEPWKAGWRNGITVECFTGIVDGTCYEDDSSRLLDEQHDSSTNTPDECKMTCSSRGYFYAGVQYKKQCFCGNDKPPASRIRESAQCNDNCPGDDSQICGGTWRMNIYNTVSCPGGWTALTTGCYRILNTGSVPYSQATTACQNEGGHVVEMKSQDEQNAVSKFVKDSQSSGWFWIGATDSAKEGEWIGIDSGKPIAFTSWGGREPNNKNNEDCITWDGKYYWNDFKCETRQLTLCERQG